MKRFLYSLLSVFVSMPFCTLSAQSLEECQKAAERNYPLIKQYGLIEKATDFTVGNIQKGWLPQITASAQATYQSDVMSWPDQMQGMLSQMGIDIVGLRKDQYKVGIDINQVVFDGGAIKSRQDVVRQQGNVQASQNAVNIYNVRMRVNEMYFALLLLEEQILLNKDLQELLNTSEKKLESMYNRGAAAESDFYNIKAERLKVVQQNTSLNSQRSAIMRMLSAFCGLEITKVVRPDDNRLDIVNMSNNRPELKVIDAQMLLADAEEKSLDAALMPKLGLFAQGYYGYPGYNVFEDMLSHKWSLNGMIGAKLSWNIGALYTRKNDKAKIQLQREVAENNREVFLFNNNLEQIRQNEAIDRYRRLLSDDDEIITLRAKVRKAAESKLSHGIIDVNELIKEINGENAAKVQRSIHEIEMLKEIYSMKYISGQD